MHPEQATTPVEDTQPRPSAVLTWQDVSVVIDGIPVALAAELAQTLALPSPVQGTDTPADITVTRSHGETCVIYGTRRLDVSNDLELFILLATLVPACLMDKVDLSRRLHAAGIRVGKKALLISGEGRMGKSSISLTAWLRGYEILGDDWLLFSNDYLGMFPIPKPLKPRMTAEQFATLKRSPQAENAVFGRLLEETRALIGRQEGFCNDWDKPVPVGAMIFLDRSDREAPKLERIPVSEALSLFLSQTILCRNSQTLAGVAFARALASANIPVFQLDLGASSPDGALDEILNEIEA